MIDSTQIRGNDGFGPSYFYFNIDGVIHTYVRFHKYHRSIIWKK